MKKKLRFLTTVILVAIMSNLIFAQAPIFSPGMTITTFGTYDDEPNDPLENAIDGDKLTKFLNHAGNVDGTGIQIDLGGISAVPSIIEVTTGNDAPERDPASVVVRGSNDGSTWTDIADVSLTCGLARDAVTRYSFTNATAYSYIQLHFATKCDEAQALFQIMEVQLYDETAALPIITGDMAVFHHGDAASSWGDGEHPYAAFDGDKATKFLDLSRVGATGFTIDLDGLSIAATSLGVITAADAGESGRNPSDYEVLGSTDGIAFTSIATGTFTSTDVTGEEMSASFTNTTPYSYYRVLFTSTQDGGQMCQMAEMQLYADEPGTQNASNRVTALDIYPVVVDGFKDLGGNYDENIYKAFDNDPNTKWITNKGDGLGVVIDLDTSSVVANTLRFTTGNDTWQRDPLDCKISGSNDGSTYTDIATITIPENGDRRSTIDFPFVNTTSYSYYKVEFPTQGTDPLFQVMNLDLIHDGNVTSAAERPYVFKPGMTVTPIGPSFDWGEFMGISEGPDKVFDNNRNTKFFNMPDGNAGTVGFTVDLDIYSAVATRLELVTANDDPGRDPYSYEVFGSNDGINYTLIGSGEIAQNMDRFSKTTYEIANTTAYSYYRVTFPTRHDMSKPFQIAEANLYYTGAVTELVSKKLFLTENFTIAAFETNNSPAEEGADKAVDNDVNTKWLDFNGGANGSGFTVAFENAVIASSLIYVTGNDVSGRDASSFIIYGSNDSVDFVELSNTEIPASGARGYQRIFNFTNHTAYKYYRVSFPATNGEAIFQTMDVQLLVGEALPSYNVVFNVADGSSSPLEGATVEFNGTSMLTGADGVAGFTEIEAITDAPYTITITGFEDATGTVTVVDQDVSVDITMTALVYSVTFNVSDANATAIEGAVVEFNGTSATTNASGIATFTNVESVTDATYTVTMTGYENSTGTLTVDNKDTAKDISMVALVYSVSFYVSDANSASISGATVEFNGTIATTDAIGLATFTNVESVTDAAYTVTMAGYLDAVGTVSVVDQDESVIVTMEASTGVYDAESSRVSVYPNPSSGELSVTLDDEFTGGTITIFNITGKIVEQLLITEVHNSFDLSNNPKGIYFITVVNDTHSYSNRIVLE